MLFTEKLKDMFNGREIKYPVLDSKLKYDFIFTKEGKWFYVNSSDDFQKLISINSPPVEKRKENWAIVEPLTGKIILESKEI
jgi:hypothetical protein